MITNVNFPDTGDHAEITVLIPRRADGSHNYAAAFAALARAVSVEPEAFDYGHHAAIATAGGFPATGGGASSQAMPSAEHAPELSPTAAELIERGDEDAPLSGLKAGEAYRDEEE